MPSELFLQAEGFAVTGKACPSHRPTLFPQDIQKRLSGRLLPEQYPDYPSCPGNAEGFRLDAQSRTAPGRAASTEGARPCGRHSPVAGVMMMEHMRRGKRHDPQPDHQRADGDDPSPRGAIVGRERRRFANPKNLSADADSHQKNAENKRDPNHGLPFYLNHSGCGKRQERGRSVSFWVNGLRTVLGNGFMPRREGTK